MTHYLATGKYKLCGFKNVQNGKYFYVQAKNFFMCFIKNMKIPSKNLPAFITTVDNKLKRGRAVSCPYRLYTMKKSGINQIIDLRNSFSITKFMEKMFCKILGIKYINQNYSHRLNTLPNEEFFKETANIIANNSQISYMHCEYGKRRTSIASAYYEIHKTNKSPNEIFDNLYNSGFKELNIMTKRGKKYFKILAEFIDTYLPEVKN